MLRRPPSEDEFCRRVARQIERDHPHWLIIWGPYSRRFWAFPRLPAPPGTIIRAAHPNVLLAEMHALESALHQHHGN